jgi:hypothetical protein
MLAYFKPCMVANKIYIVQMPAFVKYWSLQIENLRTKVSILGNSNPYTFSIYLPLDAT